MPSCNKRLKEIVKLVSAVTLDHEVSLTKGNHVIITLRRNGEQRRLFTAKTPSDHRGLKNFKSDVRRAYHQMEETGAASFH